MRQCQSCLWMIGITIADGQNFFHSEAGAAIVIPEAIATIVIPRPALFGRGNCFCSV